MPFFINLKYLPGALVFLSFFLQIAFWNSVFIILSSRRMQVAKSAHCLVSRLHTKLSQPPQHLHRKHTYPLVSGWNANSTVKLLFGL